MTSLTYADAARAVSSSGSRYAAGMGDVSGVEAAGEVQRPSRAVPPGAAAAPLIRVTDILVKRDRLVVTVALSPDAPRTMTSALARRVVRVAPGLPSHACVNDRGTTLGAVLEDTSVPHVLEHLIIDAQAKNLPDEAGDFTFVGVTRWLDTACGMASIELNYADDVRAIAAVKESAQLLNRVLQDS